MAHRISRRLLARHLGEQLLAGVSQKEVATSLAAYLVESRRTKEITLIIDDITAYLAENGVVVASVTSAFDLADSTKQALKVLIEQSTGAKKIELEETVDPSVLGGVKLALPGRELDATIARKLNQLRAK
jgi:F0F1-type ATP synthase delta subunit